jgi:hypothetical protein
MYAVILRCHTQLYEYTTAVQLIRQRKERQHVVFIESHHMSMKKTHVGFIAISETLPRAGVTWVSFLLYNGDKPRFFLRFYKYSR